MQEMERIFGDGLVQAQRGEKERLEQQVEELQAELERLRQAA
jgi:molybdenum-dependent DNA-binding transcriptional regulator ModE